MAGRSLFPSDQSGARIAGRRRCRGANGRERRRRSGGCGCGGCGSASSTVAAAAALCKHRDPMEFTCSLLFVLLFLTALHAGGAQAATWRRRGAGEADKKDYPPFPVDVVLEKLGDPRGEADRNDYSHSPANVVLEKLGDPRGGAHKNDYPPFPVDVVLKKLGDPRDEVNRNDYQPSPADVVLEKLEDPGDLPAVKTFPAYRLEEALKPGWRRRGSAPRKSQRKQRKFLNVPKLIGDILKEMKADHGPELRDIQNMFLTGKGYQRHFGEETVTNKAMGMPDVDYKNTQRGKAHEKETPNVMCPEDLRWHCMIGTAVALVCIPLVLVICWISIRWWMNRHFKKESTQTQQHIDRLIQTGVSQFMRH
ncbi:uncharacterized protein LOC133626869 [Colius striatus]|uniref:uncharacterized protein LOC133626869 n=1 Tax=Colius striatus TaxID=57412 RepID=UPI002B1E8A73|nr:uncharacterized protein LOC133626869 [Colius striatus]